MVVLNMGHHYHNLDPAFSRYGGMVKMALRGLARHMKPTAQLVFRTTNVGHHGCQRDSRPLRSRREAWERLTAGRDIFEWRPPQASKGAHKVGVDMFKDKYNWRGPPMFESQWASTAARLESIVSLRVNTSALAWPRACRRKPWCGSCLSRRGATTPPFWGCRLRASRC